MYFRSRLIQLTLNNLRQRRWQVSYWLDICDDNDYLMAVYGSQLSAKAINLLINNKAASLKSELI